MNVLIVYSSWHGTSDKVAAYMADKLINHKVDLVSLKMHEVSHLRNYDCIILGGSIHFGSIESSVQKFYNKNLDLLLQKDLGLFICCGLDEDKESQFESAFPAQLREHSKVQGYFGGELLTEKMNFVQKLVTAQITKTGKKLSDGIDYKAIDRFLGLLAGEGNQHLIRKPN